MACDEYLLALTSNNNILQTFYNPPLQLKEGANYEIGLVSFHSFNAICNVYPGKNTIRFFKSTTSTSVKLSQGIYTAKKLLEHMQKECEKKGIVLTMTWDEFTNEMTIKFGHDVIVDKNKAVWRFLQLFDSNANITVMKASQTYTLNIFYPNQTIKIFNGVNNEISFELLVDPVTFELPSGAFELADISTEIKKKCATKNITFKLETIPYLFKCTIFSNYNIDFRPMYNDKFHEILGFEPKVYSADTTHLSQKSVQITDVTCIKVCPNLVKSSFVNDKPNQCLYTFYPEVDKGYRINIQSNPIIYLPLDPLIKSIEKLEVRLLDQEGNPVNFFDEKVSLEFHIRKKTWF